MGERVQLPENITNQHGTTAETYPAGDRQLPKATRGEDKGGDPFTESTRAFVDKTTQAVQSGQQGSGD